MKSLMGILCGIWLVFLSVLQQSNQKVPNYIVNFDTCQGRTEMEAKPKSEGHRTF